MQIHPSAVIESGAKIASNVIIGPFCTIGAEVVLGAGVQVRSHAMLAGSVDVGEYTSIGEGVVIQGPVIIGPRVSIFPYALIGQFGQFPGSHKEGGAIEVGSGTIIREFVIINKPVMRTVTTIGHDCYLMARTQVDHDCEIEPFVKAATGVTLGGSVYVENHAYIGMNAVVHQGVRIGRACMIGMNSVVKVHVPPFTTFFERRINRINTIGLRRLGANEADISRIELFYCKGHTHEIGSQSEDEWLGAIHHFIIKVAPDPIARFTYTV